jgi:hypothetical protein
MDEKDKKINELTEYVKKQKAKIKQLEKDKEMGISTYKEADISTSTSASSASSTSDTSSFSASSSSATATASTFGNIEYYIPNYTGSTYKSISMDSVAENNTTTAYAILEAGLWSDTSAINRINLTSENAANFVQHSTFHLYGIKAEL